MTLVIPQTIANEHVLGAAIMFVHPGNGNRYYGVCEKRGGSNQDFVVYRRAPDAVDFEFVYQLDGAGRDATAFVTQGGGLITPDGALEVWASGQPVGVVDNSGSGFDAIGAIVPGIDDPWALVVPYVRVKQPAPVKMNPPAGFEPYGGANVDYEPSADGAHFFAQCGKGPQGFGQYVMRQEGTERGVLVDYRHNGTVLDALDGRGELTVGGDGWLYVTGTENDRDKVTQAYIIDNYVPFARNVVMYGGSSTGGGGDTAALELKIASLTSQVQAAQAAATAAMARANYVKGVFDPLWEVVGALENRGVGITRDDAWVLASQAVYAELSNPQSGISGRVAALAGSSNVDTSAREIANEALRQAGDAKTLAGQSTERAAAIAKQAITDWLAASIAYTDNRLLNLLWDRAVKLLRYKESTGKTAAQLPVNDQANIAK